MMLSIVTPTLGNKINLQRLFLSLGEQDLSENVEIILSTTDMDRSTLLGVLPALPQNYSIRVLSIPHSGIALARNAGLLASQGEYIFFLDDDCYLPRTNYLSQALEKLKTHTHTAWAGGYIVSDTSLDFHSSFYNYMSSTWLKSFSQGNQLQMVLGGCALFHRKTLIASGAHFEENEDKAAEEYAFSQQVLLQNISIQYSDDISVNHNPGCNMRSLIHKSWNHGRALGTYTSTPHQKRWKSYLKQIKTHPVQNLQYLPLLVLFLGVGRAAYYYRKASATAKTTHKPSLKRS